MAFIKLFPPKGRNALPVADVICHLKEEFAFVNADPGEGQDQVAGMIAATLGFSESVPWKHDRVAWLRSLQDEAVYVTFGDDLGTTASTCVMPGSELFFGYPDEVEGPARTLVERAAKALGYDLVEG